MKNNDHINFDIVLVLGYFRPLTYYLSIIKYLKNDYKIGLYKVEVLKTQHDKNQNNQKLFENACKELGAILVSNEKINTELLLIQQNVYKKSIYKEINQNITAKKIIGVLGFAWAGVKAHDAFMEIFKIKKLFVIDVRFFNFLLEKRKSKSYQNKIIIETGLPFKKYPIFKHFSFDYFLVMPTAFSFPHEKDKWDFLDSLKILFSKIDNSQVIVHKPHNGMHGDHFASKKYMKLIEMIKFFPFLFKIFKATIKISPRFIKIILPKLYTAHLYSAILNRTIPLKNFTDKSYIAVEAFYPYVKKGIIGGLSNTIWGSLFHKIPFYKVLDETKQNRSASNKLYGNKNTKNTIDLNLKYFNVPYCEETLKFNPSFFSIINNRTRNADLLNEIKKELISIKENKKTFRGNNGK